jgi:hypothetical protein
MVEEECNRVMATIDWEENAYEVSAAAVKRRAPRFRFSFNLSDYGFGFNWKLAVPALASVLLFGIGLGYLFFHGNVSPSSPSLSRQQGREYAVEIPSNGGGNSLDRLENTLAKKEVSGYFQQTQLTLTDLMKQCDTDGAFSFRDNVDMQRVRSLLAKGRYFDQNLNDPRLISGKQLVKKIDWLLFEILMMDTDDKTSCEKLRRLQEYIKKERLLFKIRLVSKDFSISEV